MSRDDDPLVNVGRKPSRGTVWVPTGWDDELGEPTDWRYVPREHAEQWDSRNWR